MIQSLVDNWLGWLGLGATTALGVAAVLPFLSWIPGVSIVLRIGTAIFEIMSPILQGIMAGLVWLWSNVIWPGLLDIADSVSTICTVLILMGGIFLYTKFNHDIEIRNLRRELISTQVAVRTRRDEIEPTEQEPQIGLWKLLPWNW
jgi:hypothetical protein